MLLRMAFRYVRFKRPFGAVQRIALVSLLAMMVGTAALVVVLSVFNGFEVFIKNLYSDFYPDVRVSPQQGKNISDAPQLFSFLSANEDIASIAWIAEENALLAFDNQQVIAKLKGVDKQYESVINLGQHLPYGEYNLGSDSLSIPMLMGVQLANRLGVSHESVLPLACYTFSQEEGMSLPGQMPAYETHYGTVRGLFTIDEQVDREVVIVPLWFIQQIRNDSTRCTSFEIKLKPGIDAKRWTKALMLNQNFKHLNCLEREAQNPTLYKVLNSERWAVFAILSFMLLIASFTIISALSMLVLEKQKDIAMLRALGMTNTQIRGLFLRTGMLLSCLGGFMGMALAYGLCMGQHYFGWVRMGSSPTMRLDAYPVAFRWSDAAGVILVVVAVAFIASWMPAQRAAKRPISLRGQ